MKGTTPLRKLIAPLVVLVAVVSGCNAYDDSATVNAATKVLLGITEDTGCSTTADLEKPGNRLWRCYSGVTVVVTPGSPSSNYEADGVNGSGRVYRNGKLLSGYILFFKAGTHCKAVVIDHAGQNFCIGDKGVIIGGGDTVYR